ncbi:MULTISPECIES: Rne/Rng family ribonuclease [Bombella]|uniref:Ribonuclease E n=1 Tax=Bombella pollinis TaxID=2967337 RepID=A0ABT3WL48_9PROT|nr:MULTISPECIES: ribonuclease E/G [Bombella]MCX5619643.1 ribonuclease E/G [Bombella pollinis]
MTKQMLIDATHAEETRVVVMNGKRVEDYDVETSARRQLKGNIYLAKVIRVEPSLQAAFVDYGGNRHGFLAFSEIHPDYFQIPVADREKLLALQEEEYNAEQREQDDPLAEDDRTEDTLAEDNGDDDNDSDDVSPEIVSGEHDTGDEHSASRRMARFLRNYRIQEVIRRRQVILVQVVKEERGNKGAALTTYLSLAGRYGVLMPNTLRGGGVSRKITSETDRRRLRSIVNMLDLPPTMAMIIRTAGAGRPETEITRDCEYLLQLWEDIRTHALTSIAPALIYEEASLIKRAIRDLFTRDIETVLVDGEEAWKNTREFTRLLMPHNANRIRLWQNRGQNLFAHYQVESHLDAMFSPTVRLESGGYLVINQTEALVAIDVNSGKSTSQRNIEETALRTNLEAAEEVARQLRLRDLAGLIVIDFIDMESRRHNNQVEKRLKDALRLDRARIQIGRISHFGLLEMSRQRLRPSIAESMLSPCPHCQGTGSIRGVESMALQVLRNIEDEASRRRASEIVVHVSPNIVLYMLNSKRAAISGMEQHHDMTIRFENDSSLPAGELRIERVAPRHNHHKATRSDNPVTTVRTIDIAHEPPASHTTASDETPSPEAESDNQEGTSRRRRRRRGGRRREEDAQDALNSINEETAMPNPAESDDRTDSDRALMPGRRRTRTRRVTTNIEGQAPQQDAQERPDRRGHAASRRRPTRQRDEQPFQEEPSAYQGPTPANPFHNAGIDIFDMMEQQEARHTAPAHPQEEPAEDPAPTTRHRRRAPSRDETNGVEDETTSRRPHTPRRPPTRSRIVTDQEAEDEENHVVKISARPATADEDGETAPRPRRPRPPRRTAAARTTTAKEPVTEEASPASLDEAPAENTTPPRKRRPTRRKKADEAPPSAPEPVEATSSAENITAPQPVNIDESKPKKRRVGWWRR